MVRGLATGQDSPFQDTPRHTFTPTPHRLRRTGEGQAARWAAAGMVTAGQVTAGQVTAGMVSQVVVRCR